MDPKRFEALSRTFAAESSRRGMLRAAVATLAVPVFLGLKGEVAEAGIPIFNCRTPGKKCDKNKKCCSGRCVNGSCSCRKKGQACWAPLEGTLCCSRRCSQGKCA